MPVALRYEHRGCLWRDPDLQLALDWQSVARPNKHWAERYDKGYDAAITFLENSKAQRTADVAAAKGQQREKTKRTQRLKIALSELQTAKYASTVSLAGKYFDTNDLYEGHSLLNLALPGRDARMYRLRGFYWYHLWKRNHHEQVTLGEFDHFVTSISFNPNGALVGIGWDGIGRLWKKESLLSFSDTVPDQKNRLWTVKKGEMPDIVNRGDDELGKYVYMTSISPDGGKLAGGRLNGEITVWSVANWEELVTFPGEEDDEFLRELCFNSEGNRLASLRGSSKLAIWDLSTKERIPIDSKSIHKHYCLAFSQDGLVIASGANGIVNLWDAQNGKELLSLKVKNLSDVVSLAFSPNGRLLAGGIAGGTVKLWDIEDRKELGKLISDDSDDVTSLVFSPDGRMLAGAGFCTVFLWDINTRKQLMAFKGHIDRINSVAFSLDGKMLASGSSDRTIKLWKVPTEEVSGALSGGKTITVQALSKGRY